jgi:oxygen-independent coproporphyrinogen-3 oxidase
MGELALYIHWPFCKSKCPYCDFNSHVQRSIDYAQWQNAYIHELERLSTTLKGRPLKSIFLGGGTPSLMPPELVAAILHKAKTLWPYEAIEITLEANPNSVDVARFQAFRQAGVNRISLGVQSLRDASLRFLGRQHSAAEGLKAIEIAQQTFERVSFDLIYALPGQTAPAWGEELTQALALGTTHLSLYQLTIEAGTAFATQHARGDWRIPEDDHAGALYEQTQVLCAAKGLPAYEISNHAVPGQESQHNLVYWRYGDYAGIGPGAHGHLTHGAGKIATRQIKAPQPWLNAIHEQGHGDADVAPVPPLEQARERLMMGLRLREGIKGFPATAAEHEALDWAKVKVVEQAGLLTYQNSNLALTQAGLQRHGAILAYILA